ncbi:MAG: carboxypeptidase-like regulatory domain-containing protein [Planctomycetaceae bacterium]|jgi:hypothetical protein|nr:carboxypeptidase-like regulatory domain-containing protein [Planctomycetaceae bacterium]
MKKIFGILFLMFLIFLTSGLSGCGKNIKIKGKVTLEDGTPVSNGTILFQGETRQAYGNIQEDGSYYLSSEKNGDGIPPGMYKVVIGGTYKQSGRKRTDEMDTGEDPIVDMIYSEYELTPLTYEVIKSDNAADFKLKPFSGYIKKNI